jgi:imidazolonepropionase-like amidohydrolase
VEDAQHQPELGAPKLMHFSLLAFAGLLLAAGLHAGTANADQETLTAFENARIFTATEQNVLEGATLLIRGDRIVQVGRNSDVDIPLGARRVDASGMTIVPAFIDTHVHTNQSADDLLRDLVRLARFGVGTVVSLGVDTGEAPYNMRNRVIDGAARFLTAGRGITAPEVGRETAPYWVKSEDEARIAVRDNVRRGVDMVKLWVDDRNGSVPKLSYELYSAVIDEAHRNGLLVTAHVYDLEDAKGLLRAGVDGLAHGIRDRDIDDEFMDLLSQHPIVLNPSLPPRGGPYDLSWLSTFIAEDDIQRLEASRQADPKAQDFFELQARNLQRMYSKGVPIVLGTDKSFDFPNGDKPWAVHLEMEDMVLAGTSPMDVLLSATRTAADFLGLADRGTLKSGTSADFVILRGNPLEDIRNTRLISSVCLRGEVVDRIVVP